MYRVIRGLIQSIGRGGMSFAEADSYLRAYDMPSATEFEKTFLRTDRIKRGNHKLDKSVGIWSLPAVFTCTNCDACKDKCYAMKAQRQYSNTRKFRFLNYVLAKHYPEHAQSMIIHQIKKQKIKAMRIHESGDFFSDDYSKMWLGIATALPATKFFFYTKAPEHAALIARKNVNRVKSILPDGSINFAPLDEIQEKAKKFGYPICPATLPKTRKTTTCGKSCKLCQKKEHVLFVLH